jgi:diacylglycerol kinase (ATP)
MWTSDQKATPRPLVIANPKAGRGRAARELTALVDPLRRALGDFDLVCTNGPGHAADLAATAVGRRCPLVVSFGGDGTLSEIVNGLLGAAQPSVPPGGQTINGAAAAAPVPGTA